MTPHQFTLDLLPLPTPTLDNFVAGANGAALAALRDVLAGRGPCFVHLWGPPGSGRSHLLAAVRGAAGGPAGRPPGDSAPARATGALARPAGSPPAAPPEVAAFAGPGIYVCDDVQGLDRAGQARLFGLQNAVRQQPGCFLVTAADQPPAHLALREDVRSRLAWGLVFALHTIAEPEQAAALAAYARARGARVDEDLVPYMLTRLPRDMRILVSVLDALDAFALSRQRALTVPLLREWLQRTGMIPRGESTAPAAGTAAGPHAASAQNDPQTDLFGPGQ